MSTKSKIVMTISGNNDENDVPLNVQLETVDANINGHDAFVAMFAGMGIISEEVLNAAIDKFFPEASNEDKARWFAAFVRPIAGAVGTSYAQINETLNIIMDVIARADVDIVNGLVDAIMNDDDMEVVDDDGVAKSGE
jgi:hypothetical protein